MMASMTLSFNMAACSAWYIGTGTYIACYFRLSPFSFGRQMPSLDFLRKVYAPPQKVEGGHLPPLPPWLRRHLYNMHKCACSSWRVLNFGSFLLKAVLFSMAYLHPAQNYYKTIINYYKPNSALCTNIDWFLVEIHSNQITPSIVIISDPAYGL